MKKQANRIILFALVLLLGCRQLPQATESDAEAAMATAPPVEIAERKLDSITQDKISRTERGMKYYVGRMSQIAVNIEPKLADISEELRQKEVLKNLDEYAGKNALFRKFLWEYRLLEQHLDRLRNPRPPEEPKLSLISYPKIDVESLGIPELPESIRKKPWSWDRIHRYTAIWKVKPYTEDDIKTLANFDMIQLGNVAEAKDRDLVGRLKKYNPDMICLGYRNVIIWHESFDSDLFREHPEWFMKHFDTGAIMTMGRTGAQAKKPLFDFRVKEMRDWWIEDIGKQCEIEGVDGVLIDALPKVLSGWWPKQKSIGSDPQSSMEYNQLFVEKVLKENIKANKDKGLIIANALRAGYEDCLKSYVDAFWHGSYLEWIESHDALFYEELLGGFIDTCIQIGKDPGDKVLCFQFEPKPPPPPKADVTTAKYNIPESIVMPDLGENFDDSTMSDEEIERVMRETFPYKLAIFLICANKYSYMGYNTTRCADDPKFRWYPQYPEHNKKIGEPLGHAVKKGNYYYEREFENVSVKLNIETREAVINWK